MESTTGTTQTTGTTTNTEIRPEPINHYQWKARIREQAEFHWPDNWIFDEYNEESEGYEFYYYDLDGIEGCMALKPKDIMRMYLFMKKTESEQRYDKHRRDS
jgi:hypothetical protein